MHVISWVCVYTLSASTNPTKVSLATFLFTPLPRLPSHREHGAADPAHLHHRTQLHPGHLDPDPGRAGVPAGVEAGRG